MLGGIRKVKKLPVWQMIKEAAEQSKNPIISYGEIREYILSRDHSVNPLTINCQIIACSVNQPSRLHYPGNNKPRICNTRYDFLLNMGRGTVTLYDPAKHGLWAIEKNTDGKLKVVQLGDAENSMAASVSTCKPSSLRVSPKREPRVDVPKPSKNEVCAHLEKWDGLENYTLQEKALNKLFFQVFPKNEDICDVLIKVAALNEFYSTNIFSVYTVAKHIVDMQIDERLMRADETLVNELASVRMDSGSTRNFYSFATKYCSHHKPLDYPIYDRYVEKALKYFRDVDAFAFFRDEELKDFLSFKRILLQFQRFYGLEAYSLKGIDRYIWQMGKEKFPNSTVMRRGRTAGTLS